MAFSLPTAWIEQEENLWSKLLLILLCSIESLLFHSCGKHSEVQDKMSAKARGWWARGQKSAAEGGMHYGQPSFRASKELCREAALRPVVEMPKENVPSPLFWDHTAFSKHCHYQTERQQQPLLRAKDLPSPGTKQCLIPFLLLNRSCLACRTALLVGSEDRKTRRTTHELIRVLIKFLWIVPFW